MVNGRLKFFGVVLVIAVAAGVAWRSADQWFPKPTVSPGRGAANAADAPSCVNCATEQTLPSADVVPDPPATVPSNDPAVQAHLPGCAVWTDRCVICQRDAGKISCSNIGIACQPQAVECVRAEPVEEKK